MGERGTAFMFPKPVTFKDKKFLKTFQFMDCVIQNGEGEHCNQRPVDPSHLDRVSQGGGDTPENVAPMCRTHHWEWERCIIKFTKKYNSFQDWLREHGRFDILEKAGIFSE